ncbi:hypothetical protein TKK_0003489 [Trichogramma kaykai]
MSIPSYLKEDLNWWKMAAQNGKNPIRYGDYKLEIYTDASLTGWGAYANNTITNGFWNDSEREWHINCLELQAIFFGLKCFASKLTNCEILLRCDNITTISYVNKLGGVQHKRLNNLARDIWKFCEARGLWLFATYIPSKANVNADAASRIKNIDTEWELSDKAFKRIESDFGPFDVDLFASRLNNKCKTFCSWHQDPDALITDAFTIPWKNKKFYAFPPFSLILKTLRKIINEEAEGVVVVPCWKTQPCYPLYLSLLESEPTIFSPSSSLLLSPDRRILHPLAEKMSLMAGRLSGKRSKSKDILKKPQRY